MSNKVKVTADEAGAVIVISDGNSEYGHIRVIQERVIFDDRGWARKKPVSALVPGTVEDLKSLGWVNHQELEGKVIVKESLKPFNPKDPDRDLKIAGKTGIICCQDGKPIYRKTFYNEASNAGDILIEHTNGEDIRNAYLASVEKEGGEKKEGDFAL
jgi:hypothetical protein